MSSDGAAIRAELPKHVAEVEAAHKQLFPFSTVSAAEEAFRNEATKVAGQTGVQCNQQVTSAVSGCRGLLCKNILLLGQVSRWIGLNVPTIEDGGNFGVQVMLEVRKYVTDGMKTLQDLLDKLTDYHKDRASAVKEVAASKTTTETQSQSEDDKDGKKSSKSSESKTAVATASVDAVMQVAVVDTKYYFIAMQAAQAVHDVLSEVNDMSTKNIEKIVKPRGHGHGGRHMY
eukprot:GDKH01005414.1.p2 GENE.GDKH01005414.1~~GDKH01005414.1.p2  ORF type:complete len:230 (-),score=63.56 GDKH01005414.1:259-948(-)